MCKMCLLEVVNMPKVESFGKLYGFSMSIKEQSLLQIFLDAAQATLCLF